MQEEKSVFYWLSSCHDWWNRLASCLLLAMHVRVSLIGCSMQEEESQGRYGDALQGWLRRGYLSAGKEIQIDLKTMFRVRYGIF